MEHLIKLFLPAVVSMAIILPPVASNFLSNFLIIDDTARRKRRIFDDVNDEIGSLEAKKNFLFFLLNMYENVEMGRDERKSHAHFFFILSASKRIFFWYGRFFMWMKNGYYRRPLSPSTWGKISNYSHLKEKRANGGGEVHGCKSGIKLRVDERKTR